MCTVHVDYGNCIFIDILVFQIYMGLDERNPDFVLYEQQIRRPACASAVLSVPYLFSF